MRDERDEGDEGDEEERLQTRQTPDRDWNEREREGRARGAAAFRWTRLFIFTIFCMIQSINT
jgi:hypothetical protein